MRKPSASDVKQAPHLDARERIWQVVQSIPSGKVCSYGRVAELAELGRAARLVGRVLRALPKHSKLPWHRVINAQGKISLAAGSAGYIKQRERLEAEAVEFNLGGTVSLVKFGY